ncbi:Acyl-CoA dehydrogenase, short-chain specific [Achromobacter insolitus]|uniref:acyl-CoA dehydrogenase family protein n=1 Tax=Achromobacter insolitus TaxID=217204 RepID=UPI000B5198D9|nr:acyl-CoA dehydrogenase family protein [Achromobacter insolitus]OWT64665.1 acyl-CoA dehydrogenase [Achromobacter insolitus]CAB3711796.1 Acyl-CoA dehydrogenase [Achromobacter insolitus]VEG70662.1 Acyl-CoA dehydrogenase, short-chain specific [Achromobacter insolitus]
MNRQRKLFSADHELFRDTVARFIADEITPNHYQWEQEGLVPRDLWRKAGAAGILLPSTPEEYGGGGGDFLHTIIVVEEIARALATGVTGFTTHSDIVAPYLLNFGTERQKQRDLPGMAQGDIVASIAMTEPGAGSDVKAIRTAAAKAQGGYVINGQKTFITNGFHADRVLVVAKTDPAAGARGISLFWVDTATPGFTRGRLLDKVGQKAQDTAELFFQDMYVPDEDMLGEPGQGFGYLMKELVRERLMIAVRCAMALESALQWTVDYTKERRAFDKALIDNQHIRFKLADIKTLAAATRAFVDGCVQQYLDGELDAGGAAMAKLWGSEATSAIDDLLQFHGGYGYMREYPIARAYTDVRPNRIYGGASEVMRELIARTL